MNVFIDESGHSGANLYDPEQPIYACAAIWVGQEQEADLVSAIRALHRSRNVPMSELKGGRLVKSNPGRKILIALGELCCEHGVEVSLIAQHKPFMAAAVFIEDCTDHVHNPAFDANWTWDTRKKEPAAQFVLEEVEAPILMRWWRARRGDDPSEFEVAHRNIVKALRHTRMNATFVEELASVDLTSTLTPRAQRKEQLQPDYSPNLTTFSQMLHSIKAHAEDRGTKNVCIVHDEQVEFEDSFRRTVGDLRNAGHGKFTLPNGNTLTLPISSHPDWAVFGAVGPALVVRRELSTCCVD